MIRVVLLLTSVIFQLIPTETIDSASDAYKTGNYAHAIMLYELLIDSNFHTEAIFFNLGNAYYASGQPGLALVNYLRAKQLSPRDDEINIQINLIRSERVDTQGGEIILIDSIASFSQAYLTTSELLSIVFLLWITLFLLALGWFFFKKTYFYLRNVLMGYIIVIMLGLLLLTTRLYVEAKRPKAVVIDLVVEARSGPGEDYLVLYPLYAGAELRVLEERQGWSRVVLPDGRQNWLPESTLAMVRMR